MKKPRPLFADADAASHAAEGSEIVASSIVLECQDAARLRLAQATKRWPLLADVVAEVQLLANASSQNILKAFSNADSNSSGKKS